MVRIFVVNLKKSIERKKYISKLLTSMDFNFEFFEAIDGSSSKLDILDCYDENLSQSYRCKSLSKGQIGCYASHYLLWQKCVELGEPILIIEDDIDIDKINFIEFYNLAENLNSKYEFIRLSKHRRRKWTSKITLNSGNIKIHRANKGHMSTMGYFVSPDGAKKFIDNSLSWYMPVDIFMDRFWIHKAEPYGIEPALVFENKSFYSDIGYEKKAKRKLMNSIR